MQLYDYVTSIFYNNSKQSIYNMYAILDFADAITCESFHKLGLMFVQNNPELSTYLTMVDDCLQWAPASQSDRPCENVGTYCTYLQVTKNEFELHTTETINNPITSLCKWHLTLLNDGSTRSSRLIWTVSHAYCDAYKCIDMLLKGFTSKQDYVPPTKKTKITNIFENAYYLVIGTIALFAIHIKLLMSIIYKALMDVFTYDSIPNKQTKDIIIECEPIYIRDVKQIAKKYEVTVNDLLIGVVFKAFHYYYEKLKMDVHANAHDIFMPFNLNDGNSLQTKYIPNNVCFAYLEKCDASNSECLMKYIHKWMNMYKHSAFLSVCVQLLKGIYYIYPKCAPDLINNIGNNCLHPFVQFTNIIAPNTSDFTNHVCPDVASVRAGVNPLQNSISIVSTTFDGRVRFTVSCKKGAIKHTKLFRSCIAKAFRGLAKDCAYTLAP
jgi:hypothetical protein